jgi:hypothetical protein
MATEKEIPFSEDRQTKKIIRIWFRIIALILIPVYALLGWLRLAEALKYWDYLLELNIWPRPLYFAITGMLLGVCFTIAWILLLLNLKIGIVIGKTIGWIFLAWFWVDRIWLSLKEAFYDQLFIALLITAITLIWIYLLSQFSLFHEMETSDESKTGTGS